MLPAWKIGDQWLQRLGSGPFICQGREKSAFDTQILGDTLPAKPFMSEAGQPWPCTAVGSISKVILTWPGWAQGYLSFPRYFLARESICADAPSSVTRPTRPRIWM